MTTRPIPDTIDAEFRRKLSATAEANNSTPEAVYALWHEYCRTCSSYDQSPVWSEFRRWNAAQLPCGAAD